MTAPTGLLAWGQAGEYNGIDDRRVIAALCRRASGIVTPTVFSAGSGLAVTIGAGWLAVVDCGDGTNAVIGTSDTLTVTPAAGGGSARTDNVWVDIDADTAEWEINLRANVTGRLGVSLGTITVPAGASTSGAMSFNPADRSAAFAPWQDAPRGLVAMASVTDETQRTGQSWSEANNILSPSVNAVSGRVYRVRASCNYVHMEMASGDAGRAFFAVGRGGNQLGNRFQVSTHQSNAEPFITAEYIGVLSSGSAGCQARIWRGASNTAWVRPNTVTLTVEDLGLAANAGL